MKKTVLIIVLFAVTFSVSAQSVYDELSGRWKVEPFIAELEDGLLVGPEARYAYPYTGISEINFLDAEFVVFTVDGLEHRAFYEVETLDFDNYNINCTFKGGETFLLKLVKNGTVLKILYRISAESILKGSAPGDLSEQTKVDDEPSDTDDLVQPEASMDESPEEIVPESLYAGRIIKIEE